MYFVSTFKKNKIIKKNYIILRVIYLKIVFYSVLFKSYKKINNIFTI